jgi:beta-alanine--pyruvate transaminase
LVPPRGYLERLREICDAYGILLIFDEVICGFGRLGTPFAADAFGVIPDIMTMAKALTNAAQPMGAVAVSNEIHEAITESAPNGTVELFHGYTYSAHPAACAAGIATLDIFEKENLIERAANLSSYFLEQIFGLSDIPIISDIRGYGLFAGFDLDPINTPGLRGLDFQKRLYRNGLHLKMTSDAGLVAPPLISEKRHIDRLCDILRQTLAEY